MATDSIPASSARGRVALEGGEDDEREDDGEPGADDAEDVAGDGGLLVALGMLLPPATREDSSASAQISVPTMMMTIETHIESRPPLVAFRSPSLGVSVAPHPRASDVDTALCRGGQWVFRRGSATARAVAERGAAAGVRSEGALRSAVVGGAEAPLAGGAVEHRAVARGLADHGDPHGRAAPEARPSGPPVDVGGSPRVPWSVVRWSRLVGRGRAGGARARRPPSAARGRARWPASTGADARGRATPRRRGCRLRRGCAGRAGQRRSSWTDGQTPRRFDGVPRRTEDVGTEVADQRALLARGHDVEVAEAQSEGGPPRGAQHGTDLGVGQDRAGCAVVLDAPLPLHPQVGVDRHAALEAVEDVLPARAPPGSCPPEVERRQLGPAQVGRREGLARQGQVEPMGRPQDGVTLGHASR